MGEPGLLDYVYDASNLFVHWTCLPMGLVALKHAEEETFPPILNRFLVTLFVCAGFDWFGKSLSNIVLIFLANITSAGVKADGAFF